MIDASQLTESEAAAAAALQEEAKRLVHEHDGPMDAATLIESARALQDFTRDPEFGWMGPNLVVIDGAVPPLAGRTADEIPEWESLLNFTRLQAWAALSTKDKVDSLTGTVASMSSAIAATDDVLMNLAERISRLEQARLPG